MAYGDTGGAVTELIITCQTPRTGPVNIHKGDAVRLIGPYEVTNEISGATHPVFGQAMADADDNEIAIPIKVRGISIFEYEGQAPLVNGVAGVAFGTAFNGQVSHYGDPKWIRNTNVKVDQEKREVHVLL